MSDESRSADAACSLPSGSGSVRLCRNRFSSCPTVMAGPVPAIHVSRHRGASGEGARRRPDVDTRNKSGHDGGGVAEFQGAATVSPTATEPIPKLNRTAVAFARP